MGFSFRSFFGKGGSSDGTADAPVNTMTPPANMNVPTSPFQSAPASGESPFANSMLFKTHGGHETLGQPVQAAPFNPFTPPGSGAAPGLTVGDILPALPADVSKNSDLSPLQTIALPVTVMENALRGGKGTVPIYELYRACPALFQMPVSPHDPREVSLPPAKLSQLLSAKSHQPAQGTAPVSSSPFGFGAHLAASQQTPGAPVSPFGMTSMTPAPASEEPIYQPSPFSIAAPQADPAFPNSPQGFPAQQTSAPLPFPAPPNSNGNPSPANPFFTAPAMPAASPFSIAQAPPLEAQAPGASPFGQSQPGAASPAFPPKNMESFFGQVSATDEPAKSEPAMFGAPLPAKNDPVLQATGGFFGGTPAATPPPASSPAVPATSGFGATADINPFFGAPPIEKDSATQLPPVPSMNSDFGRPMPHEKPADVSPSASAQTATPLTNPFARIQALAKSKEAATAPVAAAPINKEAPAFGGGFLSPEPPPSPADPGPLLGKTDTSIFESLGLPTIGAQAPISEPAKTVSVPTTIEPEVIKLGLAASLKNCAPDDLGTSPEHIPSWVKFSLSVDPIRGQLATGRVTIPFSTVLEGLEPEVRGIFAKARPALMVDLAANEVFHALTSSTTASAETTNPAAVPSADNSFQQPMDPFAAPAKTEWKEAPANKEAESRFWAELPTATVPSTLFTLAKQDTFAIEKNEPAISEVLSQEIAIEARPEISIPANQATGIPEFKTVAPLPQRNTAVRSETPGNINETRRLMLAVLLGTSDVPDAGAFATLTRQLPGVSAVLCMHDDRVVAADGDESCEAERFLREAPLKMRMLPSLTALTGIEDTETLHIQSGQGEATFCLQGAVTFAVLHDPHRREPVLKEKITLLGRELAAMLRDNPPA